MATTKGGPANGLPGGSGPEPRRIRSWRPGQWIAMKIGAMSTYRSYRLLAIVLSAGCLLVIYYYPPLKLRDDRIRHTELPPSWVLSPNSRLTQLVQAEHQKATDEIKMRLERDNAWFQYKFILLGALLLGFAAKAVKEGDVPSPELVRTLVSSEVTSCLMAVAVIISIAADIHIRNNVLMTNQLGLWIHHYVETPIGSAAGSTSGGAPPSVLFWGWESFLRDKDGTHDDSLTGLLFWPNNHFLTLFIFIFFIVIYQNYAVSAVVRDRHHRWLKRGVFASTMAALFILTVITHACPPLFGYTDPRWLRWDRTWSNERLEISYLASWFLIVVVNLPPLLYRGERSGLPDRPRPAPQPPAGETDMPGIPPIGS